MTSLDYLRFIFLNSAHATSLSCDFIQPVDAASENYIQFQTKIQEGREAIINANTIEQFDDVLRKMCADLIPYVEEAKKYPENYASEKLNVVYFGGYLDDPEFWMNHYLPIFKEKTDSGFFQKKQNDADFCNDGIQHNENKSYPFEEILEYANEILRKYNLRNIDLSKIEPSKHYNKLIEVDHLFSQVANTIGVTPDCMGIDGSLGFQASPYIGEASFNPHENLITLGERHAIESTLLHEWIHAVDYHVGNKIIPGKMASNIEESVSIHDSNEYASFRAIKDLTQDTFSKTPELAHFIKIKLLQEGASKFLSDLVGDEFYLASPHIKEQLESEYATICVNNYLTNHLDPQMQDNLIHLLGQTELYTEKIGNKIKNPNKINDILPAKKYFDKVNENTLGKQSAYQLTSKLSRFGYHFSLSYQCIKQNGFWKQLGPNRVEPAGNSANFDYLIQPSEMLARKFEGEYYLESLQPQISFWKKRGVLIFDMTKNAHFENNKNKMLETVFGEDKVLAPYQPTPEIAPPQKEMDKISKRIEALREKSVVNYLSKNRRCRRQ